MTKKPERIDCVDVKRRAQHKLTRALAGKTPAEQVAMLRRMAAQSPLWKRLAKPSKRRSTG